VQANLGSISRTFLFGFTQPYIKNRPINLGFQIYNNKQDYNAQKNYQTTTGASLIYPMRKNRSRRTTTWAQTA